MLRPASPMPHEQPASSSVKAVANGATVVIFELLVAISVRMACADASPASPMPELHSRDVTIPVAKRRPASVRRSDWLGAKILKAELHRATVVIRE